MSGNDPKVAIFGTAFCSLLLSDVTLPYPTSGFLRMPPSFGNFVGRGGRLCTWKVVADIGEFRFFDSVMSVCLRQSGRGGLMTEFLFGKVWSCLPNLPSPNVHYPSINPKGVNPWGWCLPKLPQCPLPVTSEDMSWQICSLPLLPSTSKRRTKL